MAKLCNGELGHDWSWSCFFSALPIVNIEALREFPHRGTMKGRIGSALPLMC